MKLARKDRLYIFFIVLLALLFVGMFYIAITGWLYKDEALDNMHLRLGESAVVDIEDSQAQILCFNFDGAWLGGQSFKQNISIRNSGEDNVYLRAKLTIFSENNVDPEMSLETNENWVMEDDGYIYFNDSLTSLAVVALSSGIKLNENTQLASKTNYIISIQIESLSTKFDRKSVWKN